MGIPLDRNRLQSSFEHDACESVSESRPSSRGTSPFPTRATLARHWLNDPNPPLFGPRSKSFNEIPHNNKTVVADRKVERVSSKKNGTWRQSLPRMDQQSTTESLPPMSKSTMQKMAQRRKQLTNRSVMSVPVSGSRDANRSENGEVLQAVGTGIVKRALKQLSSDSWTHKVEAIQQLGRAAVSSDQLLSSETPQQTIELQNVVRSLVLEVRNLRSTVSRAAILALSQLFQGLQGQMEPHLDQVCQSLLQKSGENVVFIREDIDKTLHIMLENSNPIKMAMALLIAGSGHRNAAVRRTCSHFVWRCAEKVGAKAVLENKELTERLLPASAHWLMDATPMTRYYARSIYDLLYRELPSPTSLDRLLERHLAPATLRNIESILKSIQDKGVGEIPKDPMCRMNPMLPNRPQRR